MHHGFYYCQFMRHDPFVLHFSEFEVKFISFATVYFYENVLGKRIGSQQLTYLRNRVHIEQLCVIKQFLQNNEMHTQIGCNMKGDGQVDKSASLENQFQFEHFGLACQFILKYCIFIHSARFYSLVHSQYNNINLSSITVFISHYHIIMTFKTITFLFLLAAILCLDELKTNSDTLNCIETCIIPIKACLKETASACFKAYNVCHKSNNLLDCIQSSNSLMMQEIAKCMRAQCQDNKQEEDIVIAQIQQEQASEFVHFRQANLNVVNPSNDQDDIKTANIVPVNDKKDLK